MALIAETVTDSNAVVPAPYGLLSPATHVIDEASDVHWEGGFDYPTSDYVSITNIASESNTISSIVFAASTPVTGATTQIEYVPFVIQSSFVASTMGNNPNDVKAAVDKYLLAATQKAAEREFWTGAISKGIVAGPDADHPNRYLASTAATDITPTPGTGVKPLYALALLEHALGGSGVGEQGTIHAPRDAATALTLASHVEGEKLVTSVGSNLVAGSGYLGTGPDGSAPAAGSVWMYATGPVTVRLGPSVVYQQHAREATNISTNTMDYRSVRLSSVTWNNTAHFAVLVDLSLDYS